MLEQLLAAGRRVLGFELPLGCWAALLVVLTAPYLLIGIGWTAAHTDHLRELSGVDLVVSLLGSVALWPLLVLARICLPWP